MAKDKKKKKKDKKAEGGVAAKASQGFQSLAQNPLVADVVAAALVATASALKDSDKARRLAEHAGDELEALSKKSAQRGNAMWKLALDIGRQALDTFTSEAPASSKPSTPKKSRPKASAARTSAGKKAAAPKKPAPAKKRSGTGPKAK